MPTGIHTLKERVNGFHSLQSCIGLPYCGIRQIELIDLTLKVSALELTEEMQDRGHGETL